MPPIITQECDICKFHFRLGLDGANKLNLAHDNSETRYSCLVRGRPLVCTLLLKQLGMQFTQKLNKICKTNMIEKDEKSERKRERERERERKLLCRLYSHEYWTKSVADDRGRVSSRSSLLII